MTNLHQDIFGIAVKRRVGCMVAGLTHQVAFASYGCEHFTGSQEAHLHHIAEQLLVIAGCAMEDLSSDIVAGGRDLGTVSHDARRLLSLGEDLAVLGAAAAMLVRLANATSSPPA